MKKIVSILSTIFLLSAILSSCTDLEENPYSSIPSNEFFNNEEEFLMSAGRIYAYLVRYTCYRCIWGTISVSTDEAVSPLREGNQWVDDGVWRDMHAHTWNSQMQDLQTIWEFLFGGISLCNQILYEFDQSSVDFEAKPSLVAEVLVMRAWFYLNAMDLFGNVPFTTDFSDTSLPRQVDRKFLFSFIEQQIKDNVGLLQDVPTASNYGRVTKAMAYTTLAKLYINAQEWIGEAKWDETIAACDQVIGFGQLEIEPDYFSNFKVDNTSSKENIFVILYDKVYTSQNWWHVFRFHQLTLNSLSQQTYGILDFCWNGFAATESFYNKYDPKDIRRRQWLAGPQYDMSGNPLLMQNGQQLDYTPHITSLFDFSNPAKSNEGVRSAKYEYANGLQGECMDNDYVVYRYADVLMMKGEALVRQGHADLAVPLFNEVRRRTGPINLIINIVATIIQYAIIMLFCKNKLEEIVLGKKINKTLYIVLLVIAVIILCSSMLFKNNSNTNNNSTNTTNNTNSAIENKYPNAKWVEVGCSSSTDVDSNVATVSVNLGHYKEDTVEKYKVVKIICTIYKESTNEVIGTSETYYEDVELEYGYFSFMKTIRVKLSTPFVGNDFSSKIEAYGIPE